MNIDTEIFNFVPKIITKQHNNVQSKFSTPYKGAGSFPIMDLGEVTEFSLSEIDNEDFSVESRFVSVGQKMIGLNKEDFLSLSTMLVPLAEGLFKSKCSLKYLVDATFDWLVDLHIMQKANGSLTNYLLAKLDRETREYHFYFTVQSLAIEVPIQIGNVVVTYINEEEAQSYYRDYIQLNPGKSFDEFKDAFKPNFELALAHVKVRSVGYLAEVIALKDAELAVDSLKCFCLSYSLSPIYKMFDLDHRTDKSSGAYFLKMIDGDINQSTLRFQRFHGMVPIQLSSTYVEKAKACGLSAFSEFVKNRSSSELHQAVSELIGQLSKIASTFDNYEKCIKSVSLWESIIIPKGVTGKSKGIGRIKKVVPFVSKENEQDKVIESIISCYEIRDRFLHNNIKLPIDKLILHRVLFFNLDFILVLIKMSRTATTIEEVLFHFDIR